jgi:hypothetical protein
MRLTPVTKNMTIKTIKVKTNSTKHKAHSVWTWIDNAPWGFAPSQCAPTHRSHEGIKQIL